MNGFVKFVLKNKLAVWLMTIILACAGIYSGLKMKMESIPDISIPIISISTTYPGATPTQVEDDISTPYEKVVANLEGVKSVYSNSYSNMSNIQVEFDYGTDMQEAMQGGGYFPGDPRGVANLHRLSSLIYIHLYFFFNISVNNMAACTSKFSNWYKANIRVSA